jgi:hypothetical protein
MGARARQLVQQNTGALDKIINLIKPLLSA